MVDLLPSRPGRARSRGVGARPVVAASGRASGAPPPAYYCFVDKESLVRAVIEDQNERIVGGQESMLAKEDTVIDYLSSLPVPEAS